MNGIITIQMTACLTGHMRNRIAAATDQSSITKGAMKLNIARYGSALADTPLPVGDAITALRAKPMTTAHLTSIDGLYHRFLNNAL